MTDERLVDLWAKFDQLEADRRALKKGAAGRPLPDELLVALDIRIAAAREELTKLQPLKLERRRKQGSAPKWRGRTG